MHDVDREHVLHKVIAVSGFLFALLILPVAQYFLVHGQQAVQTEQGTVAGVSTDTTVTNAVVQDPPACNAQKQQDLKDLQSWIDGRMAALDRTYHAQVDPWKGALTLDPTADGQASLTKLIDEETVTYTLEKTKIQTAVDTQAKTISARSCGATPSPAN